MSARTFFLDIPLSNMVTNSTRCSSFVLLTGTVLGIIFVAFGSVALLYQIGDEKLPGTLTGGAVHGAKHE